MVSKYPFGKPHYRKTPKRSEVRFGVGARGSPDAWRSTYPSVQRLLDHLSRFTQSESSREMNLDVLRRFCDWTGYEPDELVRLEKEKIEALIQGYVDELNTMKKSRSYINGLIKRFRTFFKVNGFKGDGEIEVKAFSLPARYRMKAEYIPTKEEVLKMADMASNPRDRAIILCLWSSGLRISTLKALNYGDIEEDLRAKNTVIKIPVFPEMKKRVPDACKGNIPYYSFICKGAGEALKGYLNVRIEKYGPIPQDAPLFHSEWNLWKRNERSGKRLCRQAISKVLKKAARHAGVREWKDVAPHCLRKAFESVLRDQTTDGGRMDKGTQEFFMGHILSGTQDPYYDRSKTDYHRSEYAKLDFSRVGAKNTPKDKVIGTMELERYLDEGWSFVAKITENAVVVRRN